MKVATGNTIERGIASPRIGTYRDLNRVYEDMTASISCKCAFAVEAVGGQPASEDGIRAFVQHHLKLTGEEAEQAVARIRGEEIGDRDITPPGGELDEQLTYGVNVIRRTPLGPYLGNWMVKANLKASASRLGLFTDFRGVKGDFAEAGRVYATGVSLLDKNHPEQIYLIGTDGKPAKTEFREFMGRVSSPSGAKSIVHHSECVPAGTKFEFEFRFMQDQRIGDREIDQLLALAMIIGLGSAKSLERGKFHIDEFEVNLNPRVRAKRQISREPNREPEVVPRNHGIPTNAQGTLGMLQRGRRHRPL